MTTSNHLYTGAAIALAVQQPIIALPLAFLSHIVLDALPHHGYLEVRGYKDAVKHRLTWVVESLNIVGIPLLAWLLWGESAWVWLAAILAISPDFMWPYRYFWFERQNLTPPEGWLVWFHHRIQWCERWWGVFIEIPAFILLAWLVVWQTS